MAKPNASPMRVIEETPRYWRAVFDYPPFNVVDRDVLQALQDLLVRMETTESLRVVVFESALPDFYLSLDSIRRPSSDDVSPSLAPRACPF